MKCQVLLLEFQEHFEIRKNHFICLGLRVWLDSEGSLGGYRSTQLVLQCGDVTTSVQLISCPNWPHQSVPVSNCVHLVDCVNKQLTSGRFRPQGWQLFFKTMAVLERNRILATNSDLNSLYLFNARPNLLNYFLPVQIWNH